MWNKIGISFKEYQRGANAGILSSSRPFSNDERQRMQVWMDDIYGVFKKHVTDIRGNRLKKPIDELAGGRVYTGKQALDLGLVDKIGSLQDAIHFIAAQAKLTEYDIRAVPEPKNFLEQLIEEASGGKEDTHNVDVALPGATGNAAKSLVEMALPYLKGLDPSRVDAVKQALGRLQLIHDEGAVLMMPEFRIRN
jgi:protease-4